jgi:hypothetical protein
MSFLLTQFICATEKSLELEITGFDLGRVFGFVLTGNNLDWRKMPDNTTFYEEFSESHVP